VLDRCWTPRRAVVPSASSRQACAASGRKKSLAGGGLNTCLPPWQQTDQGRPRRNQGPGQAGAPWFVRPRLRCWPWKLAPPSSSRGLVAAPARKGEVYPKFGGNLVERTMANHSPKLRRAFRRPRGLVGSAVLQNAAKLLMDLGRLMHGFAAKLLRSLQTSLLMEQLNYNLRVGVGIPPSAPKTASLSMI
jgi:hypothetical protein